jgi:hypothetical protein
VSKKSAIENIRQMSNSRPDWETAILDAREMIEQVKLRIKSLKRAIRAFRDLQDSGEPFPGESVESIGVES